MINKDVLKNFIYSKTWTKYHMYGCIKFLLKLNDEIFLMLQMRKDIPAEFSINSIAGDKIYFCDVDLTVTSIKFNDVFDEINNFIK